MDLPVCPFWWVAGSYYAGVGDSVVLAKGPEKVLFLETVGQRNAASHVRQRIQHVSRGGSHLSDSPGVHHPPQLSEAHERQLALHSANSLLPKRVCLVGLLMILLALASR